MFVVSEEKHCRKCGTVLTEENWLKSYREHGSHICNICISMKNKTYKNDHRRLMSTTIKCGCGCDEFVREGNKFIKGHWGKTKESRMCAAAIMKNWNASSEGKTHIEKLINEWSRSSEGKTSFKKISEEYHNSSEGRAHVKKFRKDWNCSPEGKAQIKALGKKMGKMQGKINIERWINSPEGRANAKLQAKKMGDKYGNSPENITRLLNIKRPGVTYGKCRIEGHKHRSKEEVKYCTKLQKTYPREWIHSCVLLGKIEVDFIIAPTLKTPNTWIKVIETHSKYWDKINGKTDDYEKTRPEELGKAGVVCEIEIVIQKCKSKL